MTTAEQKNISVLSGRDAPSDELVDDIFRGADNRILIRAITGSVQSWASQSGGDVVVCASFDVQPSNGSDGHANFSQYMTIAAARSLASALTRAADHAESLLAQQEVA